MSEFRPPCGIKVGDLVTDESDPRVRCPAVSYGVRGGYDELGVPHHLKKRYVNGIDEPSCARYRSHDPNAHHNNPCPVEAKRAADEIEEMIGLGFSEADLQQALGLIHPTFRSRAEYLVRIHLSERT